MNIELHQNDISNKVFEKFLLVKELAVDTETMGLNIHRDRLCLLQISSGDGSAHLVKFDYNNYDNCKNLKVILGNNDICKIFHFARFDVAIIKHYLKVDISNIYCTKIASKLVRTYTDSHGLKNICEEISEDLKMKTSDYMSENQNFFLSSEYVEDSNEQEKEHFLLEMTNKHPEILKEFKAGKLEDESIKKMVELEIIDTGGIGGTLAGNALSLAAMRATLTQVLTQENFDRMIDLGNRWSDGVDAAIKEFDLPWSCNRLGARGEYIFGRVAPITGADANNAGDFELEQYIHLRMLNDGFLITPFHNMALMCPDTTVADVDAHTEAFHRMCSELVS